MDILTQLNFYNFIILISPNIDLFAKIVLRKSCCFFKLTQNADKSYPWESHKCSIFTQNTMSNCHCDALCQPPCSGPMWKAPNE